MVSMKMWSRVPECVLETDPVRALLGVVTWRKWQTWLPISICEITCGDAPSTAGNPFTRKPWFELVPGMLVLAR